MSTGIEWTDETWNPIRGCSRVSEGCRHCYAEKVAHRFSGAGQPYEGLTTKGKWNGTIRVVEDALTAPLSWKKPRRVFVNSMSDLFHENVADAVIADIFGIMAVCGAREPGSTDDGRFGATWDNKAGKWRDDGKGPHTFQVLTKRPERMRALLSSHRFRQDIAAAAYRRAHDQRDAGYLAHQIGNEDEWGRCYEPGRMWPLSNVWLGVSVEDQATADARIPLLLQTPAAVRFISAEPLLGPIDLAQSLAGADFTPMGPKYGLHWVIVGGESGPGARPCDVVAVYSLIRQCADAGVACFVKQLGLWPFLHEGATTEGWAAETKFGRPLNDMGLHAVLLKDRKGGDMAEWPEHLRVRQFPEVRS